jgi:hypothetical protein
MVTSHIKSHVIEIARNWRAASIVIGKGLDEPELSLAPK